MNRKLKKIGTINYKSGGYANAFMIGNFIFFAVIGAVLVISF